MTSVRKRKRGKEEKWEKKERTEANENIVFAYGVWNFRQQGSQLLVVPE